MNNENFLIKNKSDIVKTFLSVFIMGTLLIFVKNDFLIFIVLSGVLLVLAFEKPVFFLIIALTWLTIRFVFSLQAGSFYLGGGGTSSWVRGDLFLNFLRNAHPDNHLIKDLPKVFFLGAVAYIFHVKLMYKNRKGVIRESYDKFVILFILITFASAIANFQFFGLPFFLYKFMYPIVFYYYIRYSKISLRDNVWLFYFLLFLCFEAQVVFTLVQNIQSVFAGEIFFGDNAIGTFAFPGQELSVALEITAFLFFLSRYFFKRKKTDLLNVIIIMFIILVASVILTTIYMLIFIFVFIILNQKKLKLNISKIATVLIFALGISLPLYIFSIAEDTNYAGRKMIKVIDQKTQMDFYEFGKVYAFANLYEMVTTEDKYFLGSGPATFLSLAGLKYQSTLTRKYNSWSVFQKDRLSSSDRVENSFVGLVGEIGFFGWLFYLLFFLGLISSKKNINIAKKDYYLLIFKSALIFYFIGSSFFRNIFETIEVMSVVLSLVALIDNYLKIKGENV